VITEEAGFPPEFILAKAGQNSTRIAAVFDWIPACTEMAEGLGNDKTGDYTGRKPVIRKSRPVYGQRKAVKEAK
jgi:hypothetical protein